MSIPIKNVGRIGQPADADLTDSTTGTAASSVVNYQDGLGGDIAAVDGTGSNAAGVTDTRLAFVNVNHNFATLVAEVNALKEQLRNMGAIER